MSATADALDLGAYCRAVETHLCRVNGGHLVRVVGPGFDAVRRWHADGIPLKIVMRGIDRRAARAAQSASASRRPLRIEFCEPDVLDVLDEWRRAVGFALHVEAGATEAEATDQDAERRGRPASLPKHLERAAVRLTSFLTLTGGATPLRARAEAMLREVDAMRLQARGARGEARELALARLEALDAALLEALPDEAPPSVLEEARQEARQDLASYASRMAPDAFARAVEAAARRMARDRLGLPQLGLS